jgi:hypothetical protein
MSTEQQRALLLQASSDLLERAHADDPSTPPLIGELVARLRETFGTCRLLDVLSASAVTSALASSPELVGGLIRVAHLRSDARLALLKAAVAGTSRGVLASARSAVLTPHDAHIWQNVQGLARAVGAARTCNAAINVVVPAAHARGVSLLLAAAATARGEREGSATLKVLTGVAGAEDLQLAAVRLDAARTLIAEDLRHIAPDHILLADAEASLAKAETFARAIALLGPPENRPESALRLLLRFALTLPDLDQGALKELLWLRGDRRTDHESPWKTAALDVATILEPIVQDDGQVVADAARIRNACGSLSALASSCSADALGWLVQTAIVDIEAAFSRYGTYLERAVNERKSLSLEVMQASALVTFACDFPAMATQGKGIAAVELLARLTQTEADALPRILGEVRRKAGRVNENERWVADAQKVVEKTDPIRTVTVNATYERLRELLMLPLAQLDAIYARIVDADLHEYNFSSARRRINEYSFNRVAPLLSFWMSGWTIAIPIVFVLLCAAAEHSEPAAKAVEVTILLLIAAVAGSIGLEWRRRHRTANTIVDSKRDRLFLTNYGVPVLIGVYSAAMSHEMTSHLALQLDDIRYAALGLGLFGIAAWALREIIRRDKHTVSKRNAIIAAARLFTYGFVIAILLNLLVTPLFSFEDRFHKLVVRLTSAPGHDTPLFFIPHTIKLSFTGVPLFPRHIVLHALFGMFVGIFIKQFLRTSEEE